jgi:hypothetical protein
LNGEIALTGDGASAVKRKERIERREMMLVRKAMRDVNERVGEKSVEDPFER